MSSRKDRRGAAKSNDRARDAKKFESPNPADINLLDTAINLSKDTTVLKQLARFILVIIFLLMVAAISAWFLGFVSLVPMLVALAAGAWMYRFRDRLKDYTLQNEFSDFFGSEDAARSTNRLIETIFKVSKTTKARDAIQKLEDWEPSLKFQSEIISLLSVGTGDAAKSRITELLQDARNLKLLMDQLEASNFSSASARALALLRTSNETLPATRSELRLAKAGSLAATTELQSLRTKVESDAAELQLVAQRLANAEAENARLSQEHTARTLRLNTQLEETSVELERLQGIEATLSSSSESRRLQILQLESTHNQTVANLQQQLGNLRRELNASEFAKGFEETAKAQALDLLGEHFDAFFIQHATLQRCFESGIEPFAPSSRVKTEAGSIPGFQSSYRKVIGRLRAEALALTRPFDLAARLYQDGQLELFGKLMLSIGNCVELKLCLDTLDFDQFYPDQKTLPEK